MSTPTQGPTTGASTEVPKHIQILIEEGFRRGQVLHEFIINNPVNPMAKWDNRFLFVALLSYATSMARLVDLDRTELLALTAALYDNILITTTTTPPAKSTEF